MTVTSIQLSLDVNLELRNTTTNNENLWQMLGTIRAQETWLKPKKHGNFCRCSSIKLSSFLLFNNLSSTGYSYTPTMSSRPSYFSSNSSFSIFLTFVESLRFPSDS
ncbi:hypothetical protein BVRB_015950 [Beta vulgaris subsp. vulgaris]|uniref:Uncharacterized protein n=1 Tax=Beta vulgaris subsp. vulgaris TaxID=3555 RepID=A0A0J8DV58_BETVV|nr:hypothetical protein BVRB_015950 [Beta vulgaris subsp. vulgaris]